MKHLYTNTTRNMLIRRRLAYSVLLINLLSTSLFIVNLSSFAQSVWYDYRSDVLRLLLGLVMLVTVIFAIYGFQLLANPQIREELSPRFNAWHDSDRPIIRIGGLVISLSCYLLVIAAQLLGFCAVCYESNTLRSVCDFMHLVRFSRYGGFFDYMVFVGLILSLVCGVSTVVCWMHIEPDRLDEKNNIPNEDTTQS